MPNPFEVQVFDPVQPMQNYFAAKKQKMLGERETEIYQNTLADRERRITQEDEDRKIQTEDRAFQSRLKKLQEDTVLNEIGTRELARINPDVESDDEFNNQVMDAMANYGNTMIHAGYEPQFVREYTKRIFKSGLASREGVRQLRIKAGLQAKPEKQSARKIIKGADGFNYYTDTGERVLPGLQAKPEKTPAEKRAQLKLEAEKALLAGTATPGQKELLGKGKKDFVKQLDSIDETIRDIEKTKLKIQTTKGLSPIDMLMAKDNPDMAKALESADTTETVKEFDKQLVSLRRRRGSVEEEWIKKHYPAAKKEQDGNWYVEKDGKLYVVEF